MESVLIRHIAHGRVLMALPSVLVEQTAERLVTWIVPGTPIAMPDGLDGRRLLPLERWRVDLRTWYGEGRLEISPFGVQHAVRLFWRTDGEFHGWYVNLQTPLKRSALGFDTMDWQLDLWIEGDGTVHWKDEDHLEQAVEMGLLTVADARAAHDEAHRVLEAWPFPTGWEAWRPDPGWETPQLPEGWDVV